MMAGEIKVKLKPEMELRSCYILGCNKQKTKALFHCWSTLDDGMHGTKTAAIVELEDGSITLVHPQSIKFLSGIFNEYSWEERDEPNNED